MAISIAGFGEDGVERYWAVRRAPRADLVPGIFALMLISTLFLTRFALTLGERELSLPLVVVLCGSALLVLSGAVRLSPTRVILFSIAMAAMIVTVLLGDATRVSFDSFVNLALIYFCYLMVAPEDAQFETTIRLARCWLLLVAIAGILQFFAQFAVPGPELFTWEGDFPSQIISHGFNYAIPIPGLAGLYKANGFFLVEPSSFSQMMALALIIEIEFFRPGWRLAVLAAGMLLAFSGTGLILFLAVVPLQLLVKGRVDLMALGSIVVAGLVLFAAPEVTHLADRISEFGSDQSSGFARFLSPLYLFRDFLAPHIRSALFGMGPGSIEGFNGRTDYLVHDPTWGKVIFEYGIVGAVPFFVFVIYGIFAGARSFWLSFALFVDYLMLGGNLVDARVQILLIVLVVVHNRPRDVLAATLRARRRERPAGSAQSVRWVEPSLS